MTGQEGRFVYVVRPDNVVEKRSVTVGPTLWRTPPPERGKLPSSWTLDNPPQTPLAPGEALQDTRRRVKSVVAITAGLSASDRVIIDGVQKARPSEKVDPSEWVLKAPK
jgi:hypothetical protein